jgi:hypothetical protein
MFVLRGCDSRLYYRFDKAVHAIGNSDAAVARSVKVRRATLPASEPFVYDWQLITA